MSEDCPHCVFEKTEANCRGCFEGSRYKPKPKTNADRIRSMSDEELADWLVMNGNGEDYKTWLDWLRQEASDGSP